MAAAADAADAVPPSPSAAPIPEPGEIVYYDYRPRRPQQQREQQETTTRDTSASSPAAAAAAPRRSLRLLQFNVERGYELGRVIEALRRADADVIALQEVDVGCDRSDGADVGRAIAEALGLCGFFLCEFLERRSPLRDARSQGGGAHGNAILSKYDLRGARRVDHARHPVDWDLPPQAQTHALARREPRRGRRAALAVRVCPPWLGGEKGEELAGVLVYSAHLEVFCGAADRVAQYADLVADSRRERQRELLEARGASGRAGGDDAARPPPPPPWRHAILGDLNTMAHGVARLSPHYAQGPLRWGSLGLTEAEWWERHVLWRRPPPQGEGAADDDSADDDDPAVASRRRWLERWGVPSEAARALLPNPGFACPFPARGTVTLDNPAYRVPLPRALLRLGRSKGRGGGRAAGDDDDDASPGRPWIPLMAGKLDWVLLHERGFSVERVLLGNTDFAASDHAWLAVDAVVL